MAVYKQYHPKEMCESQDKQENEMSLEDIQESSLMVLEKVAKLCSELGLKYYLAYGTLLGAVRHKGFIPWDDDIDIQMPRNDYNELIKYFSENEERLYPLKLCNISCTDNVRFLITRVYNSEYKMVSLIKNETPVKCGIFIDIYPVDNFQDENSFLICDHKIRNQMILYGIYVNGFGIGNSIVTLIKYPLHMIIRLLCGRDYKIRVIKSVDKLISQYSKPSGDYNGVAIGDGELPFMNNQYGSALQLEFEGGMYSVPCDYDGILKKEYGDYMELPPEEDRICHHYYKIIRLDCRG